MSEAFESIGRALAAEPMTPKTRRQLMGVTAAAVGGMGLFGVLSDDALAASKNNDIQTILNVATTAEVLATIVNTVGYRNNVVKTNPTRRNVAAAAQEELAHYNVLGKLGGRPFTKTIWIPDSVFASEANFLSTLVAGDQIFVNAYLIGVGAFAKADPKLAAVPAEFMGAEAVHRALALQSLGKLGNDRIFMKVDFTDILDAVALLKDAGFGFGRPGKGKGRYYKFDDIKKTTPTDPDVNTPDITPIDA